MEPSQALQSTAAAVAVAVSVTGVALFVATIARMVAVLGTGQPDRSRTDHLGTRLVTTVREIVGHGRMLRRPLVGAAHWFVMVGFLALVGTLVTAYGQLADPGFVLPWIGHFWPYEWAVEADRLADRPRHPRPRRGPAGAEPGRPAQPVLPLDHVAGVLRRGHHRRDRPVRARPARAGVRVRGRRGHGHGDGAALPADRLARRGLHRAVRADAGRRDRRRRRAQDRRVDGVVRRHRPDPDHGRGLAPVHGAVQHLPQAARRRPDQPRRPAADHGRRRPGRPGERRRAARGRGARRRQGPGPHVEEPARPHHVHRVRPLPGPVPGLADREAAEPQAARSPPCAPGPTTTRRTCSPASPRRSGRSSAPSPGTPTTSAPGRAPARRPRRTGRPRPRCTTTC